jgi:thiol-disulfide isomerase/thioredoxin
MKLSSKDKSFFLFIIAALVILWGLFKFFFYFFAVTTFDSSNFGKITGQQNKQWFNLSRPLEISDLKGRIILLDFWSYDCVSCIEDQKEIKKMERYFGSKLTVIGIHCPKFENQKDPISIKKAILRYNITNPVINDSDLKIWNAFAVNSWPTYILLNLHGNIVKTYSGKNQLPKIERDIKRLVSRHKLQISRDPLPLLPEKYSVIENVLNFPTKLEYSADFSYNSRQLPVIFIANSGKNNIVISSLSGDIITKIGSGKSGFADGDLNKASFREPQGLLYNSGKLYVADKDNHALRLVDFKAGKVSTLAGSGQRGEIIKNDNKNNNALTINLASPADIEFFPDNNHIAIANSGTNQILSYDIAKQTISVLAGNGFKGIDDGKYPQNSLAQTADMSVFNHKLYFIDSESSALRVLDESLNVKTLIGKGLFQFGHKNGDSNTALMQHPLGLLVDDTGAYICDSFNYVIRKYDFSSGQIYDLVGKKKPDNGVGDSSKTGFDEAEGIISVLDRFYIADSNNNRILVLSRGSLNSELLAIMPPLKLPKESFLEYLPNLQKAEDIKVSSDFNIMLKIDLKKGWKINEDGPSFINLLELVKENRANLTDSFNWHFIKNKEIKLPKLKEKGNYMLQGTIYYCEDKKNALCYIKSYEQKLTADSDQVRVNIDIKLGY